MLLAGIRSLILQNMIQKVYPEMKVASRNEGCFLFAFLVHGLFAGHCFVTLSQDSGMCKGLLVSSQDFPLPFPVQLQVSCRLCMSRAVLCPCSQPGVGCRGGGRGPGGAARGWHQQSAPPGPCCELQTARSLLMCFLKIPPRRGLWVFSVGDVSPHNHSPNHTTKEMFFALLG